jgi:hypothetical protein
MPGVPGVDDIDRMRKDFTSLQAQVEKLNEQVSRATATAARAASSAADDDEEDNDLRYLNSRKVDEMSRFVRGVVFASLEAMGAVADSVARLTTEATVRNAPKPNESVTDVARRLPGDITHGMVSGLDDAMDIPSRAIQRFSDIYRDPNQFGRATRKRTRVVREGAKAAAGTASRGS